MIVMKFGGTSVGDAEPIAQATQIVRQAVTGESARLGGMPQAFESHQPVVVVVSAMSGVTDALVKAATSAASRDGQTFRQVKDSLLDRHRAVVEALVGDGQARSALLGEIEALLHEFESLCQSIYILGELTARELDAVSSLGERLLVRVFAAALQSLGVEARPLEATTLIVTDEKYGGATPLMDQTRAKVQIHLVPLLAEGITPVVTGFIGATPAGIVTTLGRGGSDYTAAVLGHCLDSREIWIWTDVDGVMMADPRVVPEARTLPEISYAEAAELSYFGPKVGQRFVQLLQGHPWFEITALVASTASAGQLYGEVCHWKVSAEMPPTVRDMTVEECAPGLDCDLVFSALPAEVAGPIEENLAAAGYFLQQRQKPSPGPRRASIDPRSEPRSHPNH